jgi:hypothetical protein
MALFREQAADVDIIITTASIPGKKAPILLTRDIVEQMKPGSVIVDLAASGGGNCELTRPAGLANTLILEKLYTYYPFFKDRHLTLRRSLVARQRPMSQRCGPCSLGRPQFIRSGTEGCHPTTWSAGDRRMTESAW